MQKISNMKVDGKQLAKEIQLSLGKEVEKLNKKLRLAIVMVGEDEVSKRFIEQKKKFARDIGVDVRIYDFAKDISTNKLREKISEIVHIRENTAVIVQLPLPKHINVQYILNAVPPEKDVDVLSALAFGSFAVGKSVVLPPVVEAVKFILEFVGGVTPDKNIVIVGAGRLVGKPLAVWFLNQQHTVSVLNKNTKSISDFTKKADVLVSGVGSPGLINAKMIKRGAVVIDAGTSESNGKLVGDINPNVEKKASVFSPVPGGIGPLVVIMVFRNLIEIAKLKKK
jgi:methylenetetrahydrofolate dehydrogenase (NADP+)/methenyltetrahydrofolate cyclohydrolase